METTRDVQEQRAALYAALVAYLEKLFLEKDRTHYASKRWWRAILIGYPKLAITVSFLVTIYLMLRTNSKYDFTVILLLVALTLAYFLFVMLIGQFVFSQMYKNRSLMETPFYLRAYFLHSAVEFAYLRCLNSLVILRI